MLGREDVTLGVLPIGTHNFIARELGFSPDFGAAAAQYKAGQSVQMDVGKVNGMPFLVGITLDRNSVNLFKAREDMRDKKFLSALRESFAATVGFLAGAKNEFSVSTEADGQHGKKVSGRFIAITNNRLRPRSVRSIPYNASSLKNVLTRVMGKGKERTGELSLCMLSAAGCSKRSASCPLSCVAHGTAINRSGPKAPRIFVVQSGGKKVRKRLSFT